MTATAIAIAIAPAGDPTVFMTSVLRRARRVRRARRRRES
jgi:hypothetical protein